MRWKAAFSSLSLLSCWCGRFASVFGGSLRSTAAGWGGLDELRAVWRNEYQRRRIVSGFLTDKSIGKKRLASFPDRYLSTPVSTHQYL